MKKVVLFSLLAVLLLFGVSLAAGLRAFGPPERPLADKAGNPRPAAVKMSCNAYNRAKLALGSFDLVNGLTKHDLESMKGDRSLGFYYLVACLWLVLGLRLGPRRSFRRKSRRDL